MRPIRVVVLERAYGRYRPEDFTPALLNLCSGLAVSVRVVGTVGRGWLLVELSGEDVEVAVRLIDMEMGLAPVRPERLRRGSVIRGRISGLTDQGLHVDVAVFEPASLEARVPLSALRAQLADGHELDMGELSELFCLAENLPLEVRLLEEPSAALEEGRPVLAELSEGQVRQVEGWVSCGLDRVLVIGASHHALKRAVSSLKLYEHVASLGRLGLLENYLLLKLGAPTRRIVKKLRKRLREALVLVFRPLRIAREFPGRYVGACL